MTNSTPRARIERARARLIGQAPWFGALSLHLKPKEETKKVDSFGTDGTTLYYNPEGFIKWTDAEIISAIAHEVLHCANLHPYRRGYRDKAKWNEACDFVVNAALSKSGFQLPPGALFGPHYADLSAEQVYEQRRSEPPPEQSNRDLQDPEKPKPEQTEGDEPSTSSGQATASPDQPKPEPKNSRQLTETDWKIISEEAAIVARKAGDMPGSAERNIERARAPKTDWRTILRQFIEHTVPSGYTWTRPNRRFIAAGIYLPGILKENMPRIGIGFDTSGSISNEITSVFAAEITRIMYETRPEAVEVAYGDYDIQGTQAFYPDGQEITLEPKGGGGTRFQPVIDYFTNAEDQIAALIYLTDLEGPMPTEPDFPVLWAVPLGSRRTRPPFGQLVTIDPWQE